MYTIVGNRIQQLLQKNNLTQRELAAKIGVTECGISRYISGERIPKIDLLVKIANELHTTTDYLLGNENNEDFNFLKVKRMLARNSNNLTQSEKKELINALFGED